MPLAFPHRFSLSTFSLFPLFFGYEHLTSLPICSSYQIYHPCMKLMLLFPFLPCPHKTAEKSEAWSQPTAYLMKPSALNQKSRWNRVWETSGLPWCYCWGEPISEDLTLYWNWAMSHNFIYQAQYLSPRNLSWQQMPCPCSHLLAVTDFTSSQLCV